MSYASKEWTEKYVGQTLKTAKIQGLLGCGGGINGDLYFGFENYTDEEIVIGRWTDGRPVYRKVFSATTPRVGGEVNINVGVNDILEVSNLYGFCKNLYNNFIPVTLTVNTSNIMYVFYNIDNKSIVLGLSTGAVGWDEKPCKIILEYTKTTDEPDSFNTSLITSNVKIASAPSYDNYSEDEIVVGKWIDGKPLYRTVLKYPNPAKNVWTQTIDISRLNVDENVNLQTIYKYSNGVTMFANSSDIYGFSYTNSNDKQLTVYQNYTSTNCTLAMILFTYTKTTDAPNSFKPEMIKNDVLEDVVSQQDVDDVVSILE